MTNVLALIVLTVAANATRVVSLPDSATTRLRGRVRSFLEGHVTRAQLNATRCADLGRTRAALIALEESTQVLGVYDADVVTRVRDVTSFAARLLERETLSESERRILHGYLSLHLALLNSERFRLTRVLELFNRHDLWTPRDFMVVFGALREPKLRRLLFRSFVEIRPLLPDDRLAMVHEVLKPSRSSALDHLALLAEFEDLTPTQVETLFERLARAMTVPAPAKEIYPREARWIQLRALWQLRRLYASDAPMYRDAFRRASARAMGQRQIRFYARFAAGELRADFDEATWRDDPLRLAVAGEDTVLNFAECAARLVRKRR